MDNNFPVRGLVQQKAIPPFFGYKDWRSIKKMIDNGTLKGFPEPINPENATHRLYMAEQVIECYRISFGA